MDEPYWTTTTCPECQCDVPGIRHRYACTACGWVSYDDEKRPATDEAAGREAFQGQA